MSEKTPARRTETEIYFSGVDITSSIQKYLISLTYTDNEEDETDDLQIKLQDRDGIWVEKWLNTLIQSAVLGSTGVKKSQYYKVTAKGGVAVRSRAGNQYYQYGTLAYGTTIEAKSVSGGWINFTYSGKNAYANALYFQALSSGEGSKSTEKAAGKGLKIQANIIRENWNGAGKKDSLECGQFELDSVTVQGPPTTVTIKGTSLPYSSTVRQTAKSKSWENYNLHGIANEIASKNGMTCMFSSTTNPAYKHVEQYRVSDIAFLQKLCRDAGCSLKVSNNIIIIFDQAKYETKAPIKIISRGGGYTKYKLSTNENDTYTSCRVRYTDSNGKTISATAYVDGYDADSKSNQCLEIYQKVSSLSEAISLAEKTLRLHNKYELVASFTFPGDPSLLAGCIVELSGWGAWDGKYMIKQAKHKVDGSGYITQVELRRVLSQKDSESSNSSDDADTTTGKFSIGDRVMCNAGVTIFANGKKMQPWVPTTVLYVRNIEKHGTILLVSTSMTISDMTGRIYASDMHKV